jgi:hypothetical protein
MCTIKLCICPAGCRVVFKSQGCVLDNRTEARVLSSVCMLVTTLPPLPLKSHHASPSPPFVVLPSAAAHTLQHPQMFPGRLRAMGVNAFNVIYIGDPTSPQGLAVGRLFARTHQRRAPVLSKHVWNDPCASVLVL